MTSKRIESTLLVTTAFKDTAGVQYGPGDRAQIAHRSVRRVALAHPDWFVMERETEPVDLDWLRAVDAQHEAELEVELRRRGTAKERRQRRLRDELREQERGDSKNLERRYKRQEQEKKEREQAAREEAERQKVEAELVFGRGSNTPGGFNF